MDANGFVEADSERQGIDCTSAIIERKREKSAIEVSSPGTKENDDPVTGNQEIKEGPD